MLGRFFSRRKKTDTRRKPAKPRAEKAQPPTLAELEEQIVGPLRALEASTGVDSALDEKEKLIQEALRIQRQKQSVFGGLPAEQRLALRRMAEQVLMGGSAAGEKGAGDKKGEDQGE